MPIVPVGKLVLNRNPDNFFAETEQVAFCTAHVVPGIDFTNDPLLHGPHPFVRRHADLASRRRRTSTRSRSTRRSRRCTTTSATACTARRSIAAASSYEPNSLGGGCPFQAGAKGFVSFPEPMETGDKVRGKAERFADHYTQATLFWNSQTPVEQHAHHQRLPLRAVKGADSGDPRADGVGADERRERAGGGGRGRAGSLTCRTPMPKVHDEEGQARVTSRRRCRSSRAPATAASARGASRSSWPMAS